MADKKTKQLSPKILLEDLDAYAGMEGIAGYKPSNVGFASAIGQTLKQTMETSQSKEVQDRAVADASRDKKVSDEWEFHDFVRNMRIQMKAQFGESSDEVAAVGLKKRSEYKSPKQKKKTP